MQNGVVLYIIFLLCEHTIYRFSKHILVNSDEYGTFVHQLIYNSFQGYSNLSLFFFLQSFFLERLSANSYHWMAPTTYLFFFTACSTNTSTQCCFLKSRIKVGSLRMILVHTRIDTQMNIHLPKLTGNTQILTTSHKGIRFASLCGSCNTRWVKVFLLAAGHRH